MPTLMASPSASSSATSVGSRASSSMSSHRVEKHAGRMLPKAHRTANQAKGPHIFVHLFQLGTWAGWSKKHSH
eukprot:11251530-Alexandrium_andersonii.AAC.1